MASASRDFLDVLGDLNDGATVAELSEALTKLLADIRLVGKSGTLTLALEFKPTGKGSQIEIKDLIRIKPPKAQSGTTVLFVDDQNRLVRKDPRQPELAGLRRAASVERIDRKAADSND